MEEITTEEVVGGGGFTLGTHEITLAIERSSSRIDPEVLQGVVRLIDEHIARAFWLPPYLLYQLPPFEVEPLTLDQVRPLSWGKTFPQPVRDYCRECYYSNKGARFCGLGLTMEVGCTQRELLMEESYD